MQNLIGKGLIYTGSGELALYDSYLTGSNTNIIGTVKSGQPIGNVIAQDDPNDPLGIGIMGRDGKTYYTDFESDSMQVSDTPVESAISNDTSFFGLNPNSGNQYGITFTNTGTGNNNTNSNLSNKIKGNLKQVGSKFGSTMLKLTPYLIGLGVFILIVSIVYEVKKQNQ